MRYWGFLLAKLAGAALLIWGAWFAITLCFPHRVYFKEYEYTLFTHDLGYTIAMMLYFTFCVGVLYLVIWDQRYRCRTCLRRLRMPVTAGSWPNMLLSGQPRLEYICIYGHGTLKVPEVQITGANRDWAPHEENIWKELEALETTER